VVYIPASNVGGPEFKSRSGDQLSSATIVADFLSLQAIAGIIIYLKLDQEQFFIYPFEFIIY
jgi:hypothetical protein